MVQQFLRYLKDAKSLGILFENKKRMCRVCRCTTHDTQTNEGPLQVMFSFVADDPSIEELLQSITTLSTTESNYIALVEARKKAVWLNRLTREFGIAQSSMLIRRDS